jgi:dynein light chain Tctex-type 1
LTEACRNACRRPARAGAGLHAASSCFWDNAVDLSKTVKWENKTMYCICTVFGLAV